MKAENTTIILFFLLLIASIFFAEHIPAGNGLGWDGVLYSNLAQNFPALVFDHKLSDYSMQRILPSGIIYYSAKLVNFQLTEQNIPMAFGIYNAIILGVGVWLWKLIATQQKWSAQVRLISFAGIFLNYSVLKMNSYYPVLTDISALACGISMLYFYLSKKNYMVLLMGILGAFIFPTLLYVSGLLFILPRTIDSNASANETKSPGNRLLSFAGAAFIIILALIFTQTIINKDGYAMGRCLWAPVLGLSSFSLLAYLYLGFHPFFSNYIQLAKKIKLVFHARILVVVIVFAGVKMLLHTLSNGEPGPLTFELFLQVLMIRALAYPLVFLISHVLYYGPIVCLLFFRWKETVQHFKTNGLGLLSVMLLYFVLSINSESRQIINFIPLGVFAVSEILNKKEISRHFSFIFVLLSLLVSRFWLPLNHSEWPSLLTNPPQLTLEFPLQWYFMSQGPWMSPIMYLIGSAIVFALFYYIYLLSKNLK